jgi:hypothetical protein
MCLLCCALTSPFKRGIARCVLFIFPLCKGDICDIENKEDYKGDFYILMQQQFFITYPLAMCLLCYALTSLFKRGIGKLHVVYISICKRDVRDIKNEEGSKGDFFHFNTETILPKIPPAMCMLCYALTSLFKRGIARCVLFILPLCKGDVRDIKK